MSRSETAPPVVEMRRISKFFGDLAANLAVDFETRAGEVHALLGENGAGKTTLMNILFGMLEPDEGEIRVHGRPVRLQSPLDARRQRIGMVHQHFKLVPSLTVAENIFLGQERTRGPFVDLRRAREEVARLAERYGLAVDPAARVDRLSVGVRQRVEILKALSYDAEVLILDEPTAVLTPQETQELFRIVRGFAAMGKAVVFITHKLHEVKEVADRLTVMRQGRKVATMATGEASEDEIARLMVGRDVQMRVPKAPARPGEPVLEVRGLWGLSDQDRPAVRDVTFDVRRGEIVGIAGVEGNGQSELVEILAGLRPAAAGRILLLGRDVTRAGVAERRRAGLAHVPEDRMERGVSPRASVQENLAAGHYEASGLARHGLVDLRRLRSWAEELLRSYDVRGATLASPVASLSGGNIQKVVLAREIALQPELLIAAQPTRGLDVGATEFIHRNLVAERDRGRAILLVSAELSEVLSLSDRILVMYRGAIVGRFHAGEADEEELGLYMMGVKRQEGGDSDG
ncbi:MAG: ABC transporter ATP-binding protein [Clostridia bacterium]|nr:ABC transporter ATP-binding protein [Clostridia bacterium]MCL6521711.1 ABC transporter ATP-binding protein [Bacillota bacterium]